jgi:hypothetical protein
MPAVDYTRHLFGRDISFYFTPLAENEDSEAYSLTSARLYSSQPTSAQLTDHSAALGGFVQSVTTWTAGNEPKEKKITFSALTDSTPTDTDEYETYYVVVSFKLQAAGPDVIAWEAIFVWRPGAITSRVRVSPSDVYAMESKIEDITDGDSWVTPKIQSALRFVMQKLKSKGYDKRRMFNLDDLNDAVLRKALAYCCMDLAGEDNQFWARKAELYHAEAEDILTQTTVGYDTEGDNVPTANERAELKAVYISR